MDEKSYESVSDSSSSDLYEDLKVIKYENFQLVFTINVSPPVSSINANFWIQRVVENVVNVGQKYWSKLGLKSVGRGYFSWGGC